MTIARALWIQVTAGLSLGLFALAGASVQEYAGQQKRSPKPVPSQQQPTPVDCDQDLTQPGRMRDIVSNALLRGVGVDEPRVQSFLKGAQDRYATGDDLLSAAAAHFEIEKATLRAQVQAFQHVNCQHGPVGGADNGIRDNWSGEEDAEEDAKESEEAIEVSQFARDVILHVVLHELGHALVREFDLPILGNEETLADAFATHYLTSYLPERAEATLLARVQSLMMEASEVPRQEWTVAGEHNSDARRAFQIAALCVAVDRQKYAAVAQAAGMTERDVQRASDYGTEIHRSWRRILRPLYVPTGMDSREIALTYERSPMLQDLCGAGLATELRAALARFDWHSTVKVVFREGEGGAGWSRSRRTVTVNGEYVRRFIAQGERIAGEEEVSAENVGH